jgi:hypothetical protein
MIGICALPAINTDDGYCGPQIESFTSMSLQALKESDVGTQPVRL